MWCPLKDGVFHSIFVDVLRVSWFGHCSAECWSALVCFLQVSNKLVHRMSLAYCSLLLETGLPRDLSLGRTGNGVLFLKLSSISLAYGMMTTCHGRSALILIMNRLTIMTYFFLNAFPFKDCLTGILDIWDHALLDGSTLEEEHWAKGSQDTSTPSPAEKHRR